MPRKDLTSYPKKRGYRKHSGMVAWLLHRITGVLLIIYFVFHMLGSSGVCTFLSTVVQNKVVIAIMIVCFLFHALNGVRIMMVEFCKSVEKNRFKKVLYGMEVIVVILAVVGIVRLFWS